MIKLHITKPDDITEEIPLEAGVFQIGRSTDNDVSIAHNTVSRVHAELTISEKSVTLLNQQNSSVLLINNIASTELTTLAHDDVIMIGLVKIQLDAPYLNEISQTSADNTRIFQQDELDAVMEELQNNDVTRVFETTELADIIKEADVISIDNDVTNSDATMVLDQESLEKAKEVYVGKLVLIQTDDSQVECEYLLHEGENSIGRDPDCTIVLTDDKVSRKHATITLARDSTILTDLNSYNGVQVNGTKIIDTYSMVGGEEIIFGNILYRFIAPQSACVVEEKNTSKGSRILTKLGPKKIIIVGLILFLLSLIVFSLLQSNAPPKQQKQKSPQVKVAVSNPEPKLLDKSQQDQKEKKLQDTFQMAERFADNQLWEQANIQLLAISQKQADFPGLQELSEEVKNELQNQKLFLQGRSLITKEKTEEAITKLQSIASSSSYFAMAQNEISQITLKENVPPEVKDTPPEPTPEQQSKKSSVTILGTVITQYINGKYDMAMKTIREHSSTVDNKKALTEAGEIITQIRSDSDKAMMLYNRNEINKAHRIWDIIITADQQLVGNRISAMRKEISSIRADHYSKISQQYLDKGNYEKANIFCTKTLGQDKNHKRGKKIATKLDKQCKLLFEKGYILEDLQLEKSIKLWKKVLRTCPPSSKYHKKAQKALDRY